MRPTVGALYVNTDAWGTYFVLVIAVTRRQVTTRIFVADGYLDYDGPMVYDFTGSSSFLKSFVRLA